MSNRLGIFLKEKRIEKKLTLKELGDMIGYSDAYLSMVENGRKKQPSYEFLEAIAKGLNQERYYLMFLAGYTKKTEFEDYKKEYFGISDEIKEQMIANKLYEIEEFEKKFPGSIVGNLLKTHDLEKIDLHESLKSNDKTIMFGIRQLSEENKRDIIKFIETFIIKEEGD